MVHKKWQFNLASLLALITFLAMILGALRSLPLAAAVHCFILVLLLSLALRGRAYRRAFGLGGLFPMLCVAFWLPALLDSHSWDQQLNEVAVWSSVVAIISGTVCAGARRLVEDRETVGLAVLFGFSLFGVLTVARFEKDPWFTTINLVFLGACLYTIIFTAFFPPAAKAEPDGASPFTSPRQ